MELEKGKASPIQAYTGSECPRRLRLQGFEDNRYMKVVKLSAIHTGRLNLTGNTPGNFR
jgi:hypothetical protein